MKPAEGRKRVVIEEVRPRVDCGRSAAHRISGDVIHVSALLLHDGEDHIAGRLLYHHQTEQEWHSTPLVRSAHACHTGDRWCASFLADRPGNWFYTIEGWIDHFGTWCADLHKRIDAQPSSGNPPPSALEIPLALRTGASLLDHAIERALPRSAKDAGLMKQIAISLRWLADQNSPFYDYPLFDDFIALVAQYPDLTLATRYPQQLRLWADRPRAGFSAGYELFPRSASPDLSRHGTLRDVAALVPSIAAMGFDVLHLPPIHPIGRAARRARNNSVSDPGTPWAVGSLDGGHKDIHPRLGNFEDFSELLRTAASHHMELALELAFHCSPEHPWITEHPEWFAHRPDGSLQYLEHPPRKSPDIVPFDFETESWEALWQALYDVVVFWARHGVRIFRVDSPHTKPIAFWEWLIAEVHRDYPDVLFLSTAVTSPHLMEALARAGFTQSLTWFLSRNSRYELEHCFEELNQPPVSDFFRPSLWPNSPSTLPTPLQQGGRSAFLQRLILAATLSANYGIYGPAFELGETAAKPGTEEYLHPEEHEQRLWDRDSTWTLAPLITRVNQIRRENPALHSDRSLHFHPTDNPYLICYSKQSPRRGEDGLERDGNLILVVVNLDPRDEQSGWIDLDLKNLGLPHDRPFEIEDLLNGEVYTWHDRSNYVALRPAVMPAHIFRVTRPGSSSKRNVSFEAESSE